MFKSTVVKLPRELCRRNKNYLDYRFDKVSIRILLNDTAVTGIIFEYHSNGFYLAFREVENVVFDDIKERSLPLKTEREQKRVCETLSEILTQSQLPIPSFEDWKCCYRPGTNMYRSCWTDLEIILSNYRFDNYQYFEPVTQYISLVPYHRGTNECSLLDMRIRPATKDRNGVLYISPEFIEMYNLCQELCGVIASKYEVEYVPPYKILYNLHEETVTRLFYFGKTKWYHLVKGIYFLSVLSDLKLPVRLFDRNLLKVMFRNLFGNQF